MNIEIVAGPAAAVARVRLDEGEILTAEVGAMVAMDTQISVNTTAITRGGGGVMSGLKRMLAGENFFLNHFTATADGQEVIVGPALIGDVCHHKLDNATLIVQGSSWLASSGQVKIDASWQGFKSLLSGEAVFWVRCSGTGDLLFNSFGAIYEIEVDGTYMVDTGHIVAFEDSLTFKIGTASKSFFGSFFGGEGFVCNFTGQGKVYCQTHNPPSFGHALGPLLTPR